MSADEEQQPATTMEDLVFVTISHPDAIKAKHTQRCIRQRVMRDIGRARRTRQALPSWELAVAVPRALDPANTAYYPTAPDSRGLQLLQFMTSEAVYRPFRGVWFAAALTDRSAFTLCLANAAMFWDQQAHPDGFQYTRSAECLAYYGDCVAQVSRRLASPQECRGAGIINAILGMLCHDLYVSTWERWAIHVAGLQRIVTLRGGYQGLDLNTRLFILWFDVLGCAVQDLPPRFTAMAADVEEVDYSSPSRFVRSLVAASTDFTDLAIALRSVCSIAAFVERNTGQQPTFWRQEDNVMAIKLFMPATRLLLSLSRPSSGFLSPVQSSKEAARLALLILLAALKRDLFLLSADEMVPLHDKFATLVESSPPAGDAVCLKLWLWALITVSLCCRPHPDAICQTMLQLGILTGRDAIHSIKDIIWIEGSLWPTDAIEDIVR
ncbi:hypothetical protein ASPZODRAFT_19283 [Penicilliopsis zonata CBS 506.65]|uniref:Transcription factor domain-containing protein n=1 Tax=Penicilliopsis zonata CBS 506.65 TaxID=1073090 RepID=A0A1L9S8W1_9EURO|nr:hypothetical protein ASPZODRAFT_19283 [Penicilliopsis zonata CBS 506.65]OJJ43559.1 hypothetical protein ASPZODRAFT_19283 [Penicilliopsis zonata CBS 506.65]